jgi:hypothetical protein
MCPTSTKPVRLLAQVAVHNKLGLLSASIEIAVPIYIYDASRVECLYNTRFQTPHVWCCKLCYCWKRGCVPVQIPCRSAESVLPRSYFALDKVVMRL